MKKKIVELLLAVVVAAAFLNGCTSGKAVEETTSVVTEVTDNGFIVVEEDILVSENYEEGAEEVSEVAEPNMGVEPVYTEYEDVVMIDNVEELDYPSLDEVDENSMKEIRIEGVLLPESVDVYDELGDMIGYSKPNAEVTVMKANDEWVKVTFIDKLSYIPRDVFENVTGVNVEEANPEEASPKNDVPVTEAPAPVTDTPKPAEVTPAPEVVPEVTPEVIPEPVVIENTKYTPEEAVAVYRSVMEANGITWDPSIKEFASWGTGWIYLEKGEPERAGNSSASVYHEGGGDITRPWTRYYLEVTGSDANAVYITKWHCG